jgi:hypothetical protein
MAPSVFDFGHTLAKRRIASYDDDGRLAAIKLGPPVPLDAGAMTTDSVIDAVRSIVESTLATTGAVRLGRHERGRLPSRRPTGHKRGAYGALRSHQFPLTVTQIVGRASSHHQQTAVVERDRSTARRAARTRPNDALAGPSWGWIGDADWHARGLPACSALSVDAFTVVGEHHEVAGIFTVRALYDVAECVADAWRSVVDGDWSVQAVTLEWSCARTANHAIDTLIAPAFFLASRRTDRYPDGGWSPGDDATPQQFVDGVEVGARILGGVVSGAPEDAEALLFRMPPTIGFAADFAPRGALELVLHAQDVCAGLGVDLQPPRDACENLRQHVSGWPFWGSHWPNLSMAGDPWIDLLKSSGRVP